LKITYSGNSKTTRWEGLPLVEWIIGDENVYNGDMGNIGATLVSWEAFYGRRGCFFPHPIDT
jgi:hypothetical protein